MLSNNINKIDFSLLECQADIVLRALELYAYNLHYCFTRTEEYEHINTMLYHTYESLLATYSNNRYRIGYDVLENCELQSNRIKKYNYYKSRKKFSA